MGKALFRDSYQRGLLTIFSSTGSKPLSLWDVHIQHGYYKRYMDPQIKSMVFEIGGNNVSTAYMICPRGKNVLGIAMPYLVMVVKNLHKYWNFEITILDDTNVRRRFRASNFQSTTQINQLNTAMPICLADGWNQIQFNLADFTHRAYARSFCEVQNVKINANIGIRRIYFADRLLPDHELPTEYKLYLPLSGKPSKRMTNVADEDKLTPGISRGAIDKEPQEIIKKASEVINAPQEIMKKTSEVINASQEVMKKASEITNIPQEQEIMQKVSDAKLEEQKEPSHSKESNVSAHISVPPNDSVPQPEVVSKQSMGSKHSIVRSKTSMHSGAETVELTPADAGENDENDTGIILTESRRSSAKDLSQPAGRLEDFPEGNEEVLVE